jgi:hypothetical protein
MACHWHNCSDEAAQLRFDFRIGIGSAERGIAIQPYRRVANLQKLFR